MNNSMYLTSALWLYKMPPKSWHCPVITYYKKILNATINLTSLCGDTIIHRTAPSENRFSR